VEQSASAGKSINLTDAQASELTAGHWYFEIEKAIQFRFKRI
jgi:hypothetical protein